MYRDRGLGRCSRDRVYGRSCSCSCLWIVGRVCDRVCVCSGDRGHGRVYDSWPSWSCL